MQNFVLCRAFCFDYMKKLYFIFLCSVLSFCVSAQSAYAPLNQDYYHLLERYEIRSGALFQGFHSHIKPYTRQSISQFLKNFEQDSTQTLSKADEFNLAYLKQDNWEFFKDDTLYRKPWWRNLYRQPSAFLHHQDQDFHYQINPVIHWQVGKDNNTSQLAFLNTRGIELRGTINKKVAFYSFFTDNQASFPKYVQSFIKKFDAIPAEGYYKDGDRAEPTNVDFIHARGYLAFKALKNVEVQFGHDRNSIGNGYRSMILSDFAANYLFLKLNTNVWKLNYQNLFAQMTAEVLNADGLRPKKYMAKHHLSVNVSKNFNLGVFETIIFGQRDTLTNNTFDLNYLNPIIFYRSVEQQLGSPDNVLLGTDFKWNFAKRFSVYGQFLLDEFLLNEIRQNRGWWANKFAGQLGVKYIDAFGIKNLDLQAEANFARPYTYTQDNNFKSYTHYQQPLAHPLGANFYEFIGILRYQPLPRLSFVGKVFYMNYGLDKDGLNWGGNLLLSNKNIVQTYGNRIGQGLNTKTLFLDATLQYQFWHNCVIELKQVVRQMKNDDDTMPFKNTTFTSLGLRINIAPRLHEF